MLSDDLSPWLVCLGTQRGGVLHPSSLLYGGKHCVPCNGRRLLSDLLSPFRIRRHRRGLQRERERVLVLYTTSHYVLEVGLGISDCSAMD